MNPKLALLMGLLALPLVAASQDEAVDKARDQAVEMARDKAEELAREKAGELAGETSGGLEAGAAVAAGVDADAVMDAAKDQAADALQDKAREALEGKAAEVAGAADSGGPEMEAMLAAYQKAGAPGPEHQRLAWFAGAWDTEAKFWMGPGDPETSRGESVHGMVLGDRYLKMDYRGDFMGEAFEGVGYTGYDNTAGHYVSLWMDSMSTWVTATSGQYDEASRSYTRTGIAPNPLDPRAPTKVREVLRIESDERFVLEWYEEHEGTEVKTMEIVYTRRP